VAGSTRLPDDEGDGLFAEINITPLTDIFLVLLIIFMVTSSVMVDAGARAGVSVNLPKGSTKDISPGATDITVAITTDGRLVVDGKQVEPDQLRAIFERAHAKDADTQVVVQADESTHHGRVVGVMELAKTAGLRRLAIATRRAR
jgi:biopolymer transport protein ExbD